MKDRRIFKKETTTKNIASDINNTSMRWFLDLKDPICFNTPAKIKTINTPARRSEFQGRDLQNSTNKAERTHTHEYLKRWKVGIKHKTIVMLQLFVPDAILLHLCNDLSEFKDRMISIAQ
jgi:hypothetical protein